MKGFQNAMRTSGLNDKQKSGDAAVTTMLRFRMSLPSRRGDRRESAITPLLFSLFACMALYGCGSSSVKPQVGPITVTDVTGAVQPAITSLTVGTGTYLEVTLANDRQLLGANWNVNCGSALPVGTPLPPGQTVDTSCGFFTPVHTASGPVPSFATNGSGILTYYTAPAAPPQGGTVTLYASAASDPSQFSTLTLNVGGLPIAVAIVASMPPPFTIPVNGTISLTGVLSNDYTVGGGSINWTVTCGSSACGSLSTTKTANGAATVYIAPAAVPAPNTVTITATSVTDPSKSSSVTIGIT